MTAFKSEGKLICLSQKMEITWFVAQIPAGTQALDVDTVLVKISQSISWVSFTAIFFVNEQSSVVRIVIRKLTIEEAALHNPGNRTRLQDGANRSILQFVGRYNFGAMNRISGKSIDFEIECSISKCYIWGHEIMGNWRTGYRIVADSYTIISGARSEESKVRRFHIDE